jgi:PRTRC genetic system protein E
MNFFKNIFNLMDGVDKTIITIHRKGDQLTVGFLPESKNTEVNNNLRLTSVTGTPEDLDAEFFPAVIKVVDAVKQTTTNIEEVQASLKSAEDKSKGAAAAKKSTPKKEEKPVKKKDTEEDQEDSTEDDEPQPKQEKLF